ncbi:MAG TPA: MATE family efflux transporter, partial [Nitrospiria bacterium]|nr:MATE family efflux transporter [Nitrospiria bacterium]
MSPLRRQVRKEIITLALPVALSSLLQRAVGIVDIFLVGGLGATAIAAVGIAHLMVFLCMAVFWALSSGTTVVVAQLYGARRKEEAGKVALGALGLGVLLSIVISLAGWKFGIGGARFLGAEAAVIELAEGYIHFIFWVFTFTALVNLFSNILYGTGDTRKPLYAVILINILHIVIAYPLVYGHWGAPRLGIMGAAIAIGISEAAGAAVLLGLILKKKIFHTGSPAPGLLGQVIRVGLPIFGERVLQMAGQMLYLKMIMLYGTAAYAAHQVGLAIESISFMPGLGFSIAVTAA